MIEKKYIAIISADEKGGDMDALTSSIPKSMMPYGDRYKIIDFLLSNCKHSGTPTTVLLTQQMQTALHQYVENGKAWGLERPKQNLFIRASNSAAANKGTAHGLFHNIGFIDSMNPEYVLVMPGDQVYRMNYRTLLEHHVKNGADATVALLAGPFWQQTARHGVINCSNGVVTGLSPAPPEHQKSFVSMGIYVFRWSLLKQLLIKMATIGKASADFTTNVLTVMLESGNKVSGFLFKEYWKDAGTLEGLWEANLDLLGKPPAFRLENKYWTTLTAATIQAPNLVPNKKKAQKSIVGRHCVVNGQVSNSVLAHSVFIDEGAEVNDSIVMPGAIIGKDVKINRAIIGPYASVGNGSVIGMAVAGCWEEGTISTVPVALVGARSFIPSGQVVSGTAGVKSGLRSVASASVRSIVVA